MMTAIETLNAYEEALTSQNWDLVEPFIANEAVFIFSSGTFRGKDEIQAAFLRTFNMIKEEKYTISNQEWFFNTDNAASCIYDFHWEGLINGQPASGGGRGTSLLQCMDAQWQIIHEHLGPHAKIN